MTDNHDWNQSHGVLPMSHHMSLRKRSARSEPLDICPFIDAGESACAERMTLEHLADAFELCGGGYRACPIYHRLVRQSPPPVARITVHGRHTLQPTGT